MLDHVFVCVTSMSTRNTTLSRKLRNATGSTIYIYRATPEFSERCLSRLPLDDLLIETVDPLAGVDTVRCGIFRLNIRDGWETGLSLSRDA